MIIAIDGLSSCGKSTLAKQLADRLGFTYIDTGAMYRCVTLYFYQNDIDISDLEKIDEVLSHIHIYLHGSQVLLNDRDVSDEIRKMYVNERVSEVSKIPAVRHFLTFQQRKIGESQNVVMDGRDIGSVVFPDAEVKFYITADTAVRVQRRYNELMAKGEKITPEEIAENLTARDYKDINISLNPLVQASDAIVIDNTFLNHEEQFELAFKNIKLKMPKHV